MRNKKGLAVKSRYFEIHELVSESIFKKKGEAAWRYIPPALTEAIDTIKENFPEGTATINNYFWNGDRKWSGWRTPDSPYYSPTSMHATMQAVDIVFSKYSAETVRQHIIENPTMYPTIKGLELNITWLHIDIRNTDEVMLFNK